LQEIAAEALQLRRAHLPGTGALGWTEWQHLHRSCFLGEIRSTRRRRKARRSFRGCNRGLAVGGRRSVGTDWILQAVATVALVKPTSSRLRRSELRRLGPSSTVHAYRPPQTG